jgi:hypothetical protein
MLKRNNGWHSCRPFFPFGAFYNMAHLLLTCTVRAAFIKKGALGLHGYPVKLHGFGEN